MPPKTILITGSTAGIGRAGAEALADHGWRVLVHARTAEKGRRTLDELAQAHPQGRFDLVTGDLSDLDQVRALADQVRSLTPTLDALWSNAGIMTNDRSVSAQGFELQWAVNHLAPFVLTQELAPLVQAARGRIVQTSSLAHFIGRVPTPETFLPPAGRYNGLATYGSTKLANILLVQELQTRLGASGVTTAAFHPGYVKTTIGSNGRSDRGNAATPLFNLFQIPVALGAATGIYLCSAPPAEVVPGRYWSDLKVRRASGKATPAAAAACWEATETALKGK
jgi:NAD(P)-dependent dehydrogenase (short-subunit alcohol dehydrogenase family)